MTQVSLSTTAAILALCQTVQRLQFADDASLRNYLTLWMAENARIAHAGESLDLLERILANFPTVSMLEVSGHIRICTPYQAEEVKA